MVQIKSKYQVDTVFGKQNERIAVSPIGPRPGVSDICCIAMTSHTRKKYIPKIPNPGENSKRIR